MNKLSILLVFYDGYEDVWKDFFNLFNKFWPNCPYPVYLANNTKAPDFVKVQQNLTLVNSGADAEFSKKIQTAISCIDSEYVLLLLEDFFFSQILSEKVLSDILDFMDSFEAKYYEMPLERFDRLFKGKKVHGNAREFSLRNEYTISCQPSIWRRDFLIDCIGKENYSAWVFEGIYTMSKTAHTKEFLAKCFFDKTNPLMIQHGIIQSQMIPKTVERYRMIGYEFLNNLPIMSKKEYRKIEIKTFLKSITPVFVQRLFKSAMKKQSVLGKRSEEIKFYMEKMGVN